MQLLIEDASSPNGPATPAQLDAWINARKVRFPMFMDVAGTPDFTLKKRLGNRETAYVVERSTMQIVLKTFGIDPALAKLDSL